MARSPLFDIYDPLGTLNNRALLGLLPESDDEDTEIIGAFERPRSATISDLMPQEEKQGLLRRLASTGASGLSALGWILDTPGSMVRGTISGIADGDWTRGLRALGQTSDERVSGRDLLRQFGLTEEEDNWRNFGAGLVTEFVTDPLSVVNPAAILGRGAYGAAGRAAQRANLLEDAALLAHKKGMGIREFNMSHTPRKLIDELGGDAAERFSTAAKGAGLDAEDLLDQPLAGLAELRLPGTRMGAVLGTGEKSQAVGRFFDRVGDAAKTTPGIGAVVNRARATFDPTVMDEVDPDRQWIMRQSFSDARKADRDVLERYAKLQRGALNATAENLPDELRSFQSSRIQNAIRDLVEADGDVSKIVDQEAAQAVLNVPEWRDVYDNAMQLGPNAYAQARELGLRLPSWTGKSETRFFPSQSVWFEKESLPTLPDRIARTERPYTRGNRALNLDDNFSRARADYLDIEGRSQTLRQLMGGPGGRELQERLLSATDAEVPEIIDNAFANIGLEAPYRYGMQELEDFLARDDILPFARKEAEQKLADLQAKAVKNKVLLGDLVRKADTQFADNNMGLFDQSSFDDMVRYERGRARVSANAKIVTDQLLKAARDGGPDSFVGGGWLRLDDAAKQLGFDEKQLGKVLQEQSGQDITNLAVNEKLVESLKKLMPPQTVAEDSLGRKAWDTYTNAFKVGALANPAYHTRNLYSGQISTLTTGSTNPISLALDSYAGWQAGKGNYAPLIRRLRKAPAYSDPNLTDEQILDDFLSKSARNRLSGGEISDLSGAQEQATKGLYPGSDASDTPIPFVGKDGLLYDPDRTWNDWATVRGVDWFGLASDRRAPTRTKNPFLNLHERVGRRVEDANRMGAYVSQIRAGADPDAAADLVYKTQIDYSPAAFTSAEQKLKRLFPFYSYTRGIAPLVAENILYRPGGLQGQAIRAVNRASEPSPDFFTPEHLRQSAAIPLPPELGGKPAENLQRFVNNIDLPFEGLINLFSPGVGNTPTQQVLDSVQKTGMNVLGMLNPLYKAPLEYITNRQLYTGRQLSDLYSVLENAGLGDTGAALEQALVHAPGGAKIIGTARQLMDDRLSPQDKLVKQLVNQFLGIKLTDVDQERTKRLAARNMLNELLETTPGVRTYENITVPDEVLQRMPENQRKQYLLYRILQAEAAKRAREKKKQEAALDPLQVLGVTNRL